MVNFMHVGFYRFYAHIGILEALDESGVMMLTVKMFKYSLGASFSDSHTKVK